MIKKILQTKIIIIVIPALAVLGLLASFFSEPSLPSDNTESPDQVQQKTEDQQEAFDTQTEIDNHTHTQQVKTAQSGKQKIFPKNFDYKKESEDLAKLKAEYPRSERELMSLVLSENEFAGAEPHSAAELAQRQKGALKVEALKALIELDEDQEVLDEKILKISKTSKDPVIRRIARAALDSRAKGRPFFSDTVKALGDLPIPE